MCVRGVRGLERGRRVCIELFRPGLGRGGWLRRRGGWEVLSPR